ncbi:MAG TPA: 30S ribosome-binding factor RbfA [Oscillospiraceae bacterium]|mgnify:FL=1|nr:30S ribosome-binding factor RbfA [Oscillospiraceae bacterium]
MPNFKNGRISEDIKREISAMLRELKDPRISGMLTIVRTEVSGDMSHCKVFVSSFDGIGKAKEACAGLTSASGLLRREIGNKLHLKKCPELKFIPDDSIEHSAEITKKLHDLNIKTDADEN